MSGLRERWMNFKNTMERIRLKLVIPNVRMKISYISEVGKERVSFLEKHLVYVSR